jgi:hypothetical protein
MKPHSIRTIRALALIAGVCLAAIFGLATSALAAAPIAADDTYSIDANVALTVAAPGVLTNDTGFNSATTRIAGYDARTRVGGLVTLNADGGFTYTPPAGFSGRDRFTYALENAEGTVQATVTITVVGPVTWFVNASAPAGGNGTYAAPFNSLAPLNNSAADADRPGDRIFVYPGTYTAGFSLEANQTLIGAVEGLTLPESGITIPTAARPVITSAGNTLSLASGSAVRGVQATSSGGAATAAINAANISGATLRNVTLPGSGGAAGALTVDGLTGALTIENSAISGAFAAASTVVSLTDVTGSGVVNITNTPITVTGGTVLALDNVAGLSFDAASDITQNDGGGISVANLPASATLGFAGVNLTVNTPNAIAVATSNANALLSFSEGMTLSGGGYTGTAHRLSVSGTSSTIASGVNTPLHLNGVAIQGLARFNSISTATGASGGLLFTDSSGLLTVDTATLNVGANAELIRLSGGSISPLISAGTLTKTGAGAAVTVQNNHTGALNNAATVTITDGDGYAFTSANGAYTHTGVVTLNGGAARVAVSAGTGTISFSNAGSSIVAQAGQPGFSVTTSSTSGSFAGTITKNTGGASAVAITSLGAGGSYTFGTVNAGNLSNGVTFTTSAGNITFGTVNLGAAGARFTTPPIGFSGNNSANIQFGAISGYSSGVPVLAYSGVGGGTLRSTSGIMDALNSAAVDINPASGTQQLALNLTTVNATNSTRGIRLVNTGGSFTVAGDGGANSTSGGTISGMIESAVRLQSAPNVTLNSMSFTNANITSSGICTGGVGSTCNGAVVVDNSTNLTLNRILVSGTTVDGAVSGTGLNGLTITDSRFVQVGAANGRATLNFQRVGAQNLVGTVTLTNVEVDRPADDAIFIRNTSGTLNATIGNLTFRGTAANQGSAVIVNAGGAATIDLRVNGGAFSDMSGSGVIAGTADSGNLRIDVSNTSFTALPAANQDDLNGGDYALLAQTSSTGANQQLQFNFLNNTVNTKFAGDLVNVLIVGQGTQATGRIFGNNLLAGSFDRGIYVRSEAANGTNVTYNAQVRISNNQVANTRREGIAVLNQGSTNPAALLDTAILNNSVGAPNNVPAWVDIAIDGFGIDVESFQNTTVCLAITGNTATGYNSIPTGQLAGISLYRDSTASTFRIHNGGANPLNFAGANNSSVGPVDAGGAALQSGTCSAINLSDTP